MRRAATIRRQIDQRLANRDLKLELHPPGEGWLRTTRLGLEMRLSDLAKKLRTSEAAIRQSERNERSGAITLRQARRLAKAMGCELVYALVPAESLQTQFELRVGQRAAQDAMRVARTMSLERQDVQPATTKRHEAELRSKYLEKPPRDLWDD